MLINNIDGLPAYKCNEKVKDHLVSKCQLPILKLEGDFFLFSFNKTLMECLESLPLELRLEDIMFSEIVYLSEKGKEV